MATAKDAYAVSRTGGTVDLTHNYIGTNWSSTRTQLNGTINTDVGNIKSGPLKVSNLGREGFIIPCVDDWESLAYAQELELVLSARGMTGLYSVQGKNFAANVAVLQEIFDNKIFEIGVHGYSHSDLSLADDSVVWTVSSATVTVNRASDTISVAGSPGGNIVGFKTMTLLAIRNSLVSLGCTVTDGIYAASGNNGQIGSVALGEVLKDAAALSTQVKLLVDSTGAAGYLQLEVVQAKALAESALSGYVAKTFVPPYGQTNANLEAVVKSAGFLMQRNVITASDAEYKLSDIDVFQLSFIMPVYWSDNDPATAINNAHYLFQSLNSLGGVMYPLSHSLGEATISQWEVFLDMATQYQITVCSSEALLDTLNNSGLWATSDNRTYTRAWASSANYHLQPTSPCVGAGAIIPGVHDQATLATDLDNKTIYFTPSIGPYDGQGDTKTITSNYSPTGYGIRKGATVALGAHGLSVDFTGLTLNENNIRVKEAGTYRAYSFTRKTGTTQYVYGEETGGSGGSCGGIFGSNFS
jgi:hypothetical protein